MLFEQAFGVELGHELRVVRAHPHLLQAQDVGLAEARQQRGELPELRPQVLDVPRREGERHAQSVTASETVVSSPPA